VLGGTRKGFHPFFEGSQHRLFEPPLPCHALNRPGHFSKPPLAFRQYTGR
jgi:hypothetical protein